MSGLFIGLQIVIFSPTGFANMLLVTVRPGTSAFIERDVCHGGIIYIFL